MILGVDPGLDGGLAFIFGDEIELHPMPTEKLKSGRRQVDLAKLNELLEWNAKDVNLMVIEEVHSMPKQGVSSTFSFGQSYGAVLGLAAGYRIPTIKVNPAVWKASLGLGRDKKDAIAKANSLYTKMGEVKITKDGIAEALLIAHFGMRFLK